MGLHSAIEEAERLYNEKKMRSTNPTELDHQVIVERIKKLHPQLTDSEVSNIYQKIMNIQDLLSGLGDVWCRILMQKAIKIAAADKLSDLPFKLRAINVYLSSISAEGHLDKYINIFVEEL